MSERIVTLIFINPLPTLNVPITYTPWMDISKETPSYNGFVHLPLENGTFQSDHFLKGESLAFYPCLKQWNGPKYMNPFSKIA